MALDERKLAVSELRTGMYVCRLDRDWEGTPFLLQGVLIESQDDIDTLARLCAHVYIDLERGVGPLGLGLLADEAPWIPASYLLASAGLVRERIVLSGDQQDIAESKAWESASVIMMGEQRKVVP